MLYDPLAVKRLASAGCVLPPTPRSLSGPSGCQGCASSSTTESSREPGLDAGAPGRLYCAPSQEEEQQRPVVGHGIVFGAWPSQEKPAKGQGRAWGAERSRTAPFRKKDHAIYLGAQRHTGGVGGCAHQRPGTRPPSTSGTSQRRSPAGAVPVTPLGATLLRPYGSSGSNRAHRGGRIPLPPEDAQGGAAAPPHGAGRGSEAAHTDRSASDPQSPLGKGGGRGHCSRHPYGPSNRRNCCGGVQGSGGAWEGVAGCAGDTGAGMASSRGAASACSR
jgi:hypothetical protein